MSQEAKQPIYEQILQLTKIQVQYLMRGQFEEFDRTTATRGLLISTLHDIVGDSERNPIVAKLVLNIHAENQRAQQLLHKQADKVMAELNALRKSQTIRKSYADQRGKTVMHRRGFNDETPRFVDFSR